MHIRDQNFGRAGVICHPGSSGVRHGVLFDKPDLAARRRFDFTVTGIDLTVTEIKVSVGQRMPIRLDEPVLNVKSRQGLRYAFQ